uniref:G-protein coupled receptors family 2 profile 2 domain-containing protein n=1 Tax=Stomoxys calcitrans TaxID=35570 RepID=A0A1I8P2I1_STOCA
MLLEPILHLWLLVLIVVVGANNDTVPKCLYNETADLRNYPRLENGSFLYRDIVINPDKLDFYDHRIIFREEVEDAELHVRGCICDASKGRYCVNLCCEVGQTFNQTSSKCESMKENHKMPTNIPIRKKNGQQVEVNLFKHFIYKVDLPCQKPETLLMEDDPWYLNEDGILQILEKSDAVIDDYADLGTVSYCITPYLPNSTKNYVLAPMSCPIKNEKTFLMTLNTYSMTVSVIFLIPTIIIYILLKSLRSSISGRMQICYLTSMLVAYSVISIINTVQTRWGTIMCNIYGYGGYFFFMSMYLWLSILCYDMWNNFKEFNLDYNANQGNSIRFFVYSLYAWGMAGLLTAFTMWAQRSDKIPPKYKPGIGIDMCWIDTRRWSAAIYFYIPNLLIMIFNISTFIHLTLLIYNVKKNVASLTSREKLVQENIVVIMRLFLIMGISWITDIISYCLRDFTVADYLFAVTDLCNASQGVLIFFLFIVRRKVIDLVKARFGMKNSSGRSNKSAFTMTTQFSKLSSITVPPTPTITSISPKLVSEPRD